MTPPLRILVVLPLYGGSLPIGRYCARALSDMGHAVRIFDAPAFYSAFTGLRPCNSRPRPWPLWRMLSCRCSIRGYWRRWKVSSRPSCSRWRRLR